MRNVFYALLFVNLAYFAWSHWVDKPRPPPVNEAVQRLPRLKLASEAPGGSPATRAKKTALEAGAACLSVGPFGDVDSSARAAASLRDKGFEPRQRAEASGVTLQYWVYVGGITSDADADRALRRAQQQGFKDAVIIRDGADAGRRLSLGLFNERAGANQRATSARLRGFEADVAERKVPGTVYWVDLAVLAGTSTVPIQDLFAQGLNSKVTVQPCPAPSTPKTMSVSEPAAPAREHESTSSPQTQIAVRQKVP